MNINIALTPADLVKLFARLLMRFHVVTYTVIVLGGLSVAIFLTYQIIIDGTTSNTPVTPSSSGSAGFDLQTIEKLRALSQNSSDTQPLNFPDGQRINPFVD